MRYTKYIAIAALTLSLLFCLQAFAQDGSVNPYDKRWSLKAGVGYFCQPIEFRSGYSTWWAASYSLPSRLEFSARGDYSTLNIRFTPEEIENLWPDNPYQWMGNHDRDCWVQDYFLFELGVSYPFIISQRHRIAPGIGLSLVYQRQIRPSHRWTVPVDEYGITKYYGEISGVDFSNRGFDLRFCFQLEYTYHFNSGFFVGLQGHLFHDFTFIDGITVSPVIGVRF